MRIDGITDNDSYKIFISISLLILFLFTFRIDAMASDKESIVQEEEEVVEKLDAGSIIIKHLLNDYEWHVFTWKGKHFTVYLPVILLDKGNMYVFSSRRLSHDERYVLKDKKTGEDIVFSIPEEGKYKDKIVIIDENGEVRRPFDISITKNVLGLFVSCTLMVVLFLIVAKAYKKRGEKAPKGLQSLFEMLICFVRDDIAKKTIDEHHYEKYLPYLVTVFFFIFINNLLGLIPIFPFGANLTGNITVTIVLALFTFIITNIFGNREYYKDIVNTPGVPWYLKLPVPLMPVIELVGCFTKPFVLAVRLFANITAGHIVVLGFITIIFVLGEMSMYAGYAMSVVSLLLAIFVDCLELLVAFIQAYVFTLLSALYFGMSCKEEHKE